MKFLWLLLSILVMGILEVSGVASILPLMQLVADPEAIDKSAWLSLIYEYLGFGSHKEMLIFFGITVIALIGFTSFFSIFTIWLQYKYSWDVAHNLGIRLLRIYLNKPYPFFLKKNTSELQTYIISEVGSLTGGVIMPIIEIISRSFVSIIIFILLLIVDIKISLIMFGGIGSAYLLIYFSRQGFLKKIGSHRIEMNLLRYKNLGELLTGIKTVRVYNAEPFFFNRYEKASKEFSDVQPKFSITLAAPRYILEFLAFGSILAITIFLFNSSNSIQNSIPRLSLYIVAGYRLLPALHKVFAAAAKLKHNIPIFEKLYDDLILSLQNKSEIKSSYSALPFQQSIVLDDITYVYKNSESAIIKKLNLKISKGKTIAFIGSTGSGKTTLVDIIVGLLHPTEGNVLIDSQILQPTDIKRWQENLAYVPQDVFLFDDSVLHNIILGKEASEVDHERLEKATKIANIHDFIINELPEGFQTKIGERGVRISGGQRQRLGLARAIYAQPSVLILDEATSALDSITEKGIIESLKSLPENLTTIIIAHRISTVKHADCIYVLKEGEISVEGDYLTLKNSDEAFKKMLQLS